ncbi:MAG: hypothetical protein AAFP69_08475, partial [Planctomycetota bacterium]
FLQARRVATLPVPTIARSPLLPWVIIPMLVVLAWWIAWRLTIRPVLQRRYSNERHREIGFQLDDLRHELLPDMELRSFARSLRTRTLVESRRVDVDATIRRTLRQPGVLQPVYRSEIEREYLLLVDRQSQQDLQYRVLLHMLRQFDETAVSMAVYAFNEHPTYCSHISESVIRSNGENSVSYEDAQTAVIVRTQRSTLLRHVVKRHPNHRVMLFASPQAFLDSGGGRMRSWVNEMADLDEKILITADPRNLDTGWASVATENGFQVASLTPEGLQQIENGFGCAPGRSTAMRPHRGKAYERYRSSLENTRWVDRSAPTSQSIHFLIKDLEGFFGEHRTEGMLWLSAIAIYPDISADLTAKLGAELIADSQIYQRLLPLISSLIWLRRSYMPDWLRTALIGRLSRVEERQCRTILRGLLDAADRTDSPLLGDLRVGVKPSRTFPHRQLRVIRRAWTRLMRAWTSDNNTQWRDPYKDVVFLDHLSRLEFGPLQVMVPRSIRRLIFERGTALSGLRWITVLSIAMILSMLFYLWANPTTFEFADARRVLSPDASNLLTISPGGTAALQETGSREPRAGDIRTIELGNGITMNMVWCPPGACTMRVLNPNASKDQIFQTGSTSKPSYEVILGEISVRFQDGFWFSQTELTRGQYAAVVTSTASTAFSPGDSQAFELSVPAVMSDVLDFFRNLNKKGRQSNQMAESERFEIPTVARGIYAHSVASRPNQIVFLDRMDSVSIDDLLGVSPSVNTATSKWGVTKANERMLELSREGEIGIRSVQDSDVGLVAIGPATSVWARDVNEAQKWSVGLRLILLNDSVAEPEVVSQSREIDLSPMGNNIGEDNDAGTQQ